MILVLPDCPICRGNADGLCAPRHVGSWADLTVIEQLELLARLGKAFGEGATGFQLITQNGHLRLCPISTVTSRAQLTTGTDDPLLPLLTGAIDQADQVDIAVAFMESRVQLTTPLLATGSFAQVAATWNVTDARVCHHRK